MEDIESILNSGTVVDLFEPDEFEALTMDLKNDAYTVGMSDTPGLLREYFYQVRSAGCIRCIDCSIFMKRVRTNLHVILSFSPAGSKFRDICRLHPALLNCTSIDWFTEWSKTSMGQVADVFLESVDFKCVERSSRPIRTFRLVAEFSRRISTKANSGRVFLCAACPFISVSSKQPSGSMPHTNGTTISRRRPTWT